MQLYFDGCRYSVIRHIFNKGEITIGSKWISSGKSIVEVVDVIDRGCYGDVYYTNGDVLSDKDGFSFQCRYCLLVEDVAAFRLKYAGQFEEVDTLD